jgi:hypothetical protein
MRIAYQPPAPAVATLTVRAWAGAGCRVATQRMRLTILPLRIAVTPGHLVGGGVLIITLRTGARGQVGLALEVDTTRDTVLGPSTGMGTGRQRRPVRRVVALYRLRLTGTADAHGRFARRVRLTYRPSRPVALHVMVSVRLPQGMAWGQATAMLLPQRPRAHLRRTGRS